MSCTYHWIGEFFFAPKPRTSSRLTQDCPFPDLADNKENRINSNLQTSQGLEFETPRKGIFSLTVSPPKARQAQQNQHADAGTKTEISSELPKPVFIDFGEQKLSSKDESHEESANNSVVIKLQPFEAAPCLNFGCADINLDSVVSKSIFIENTAQKRVQVLLHKGPAHECFGIDFPKIGLALEAGARASCVITWKPSEVGNIRDSIEFKTSGQIHARLVLLATGSQGIFSTAKVRLEKSYTMSYYYSDVILRAPESTEDAR
jgi:hypothetical protein